MTRPQPAHGWKRGVRLGVLVAVGALGFASRWQPIPRWSVLLAAATVPVVWAATGFESQRPGESEADQRRRMRNIAIGLSLFVLVALFYLATTVRFVVNQ